MKSAFLCLLLAFATTMAAVADTQFQDATFSAFVNAGGTDPGQQGRVKLTTTAAGGYSLSARLGSRAVSAKGTFDSTGFASKRIPIRIFGIEVASIDLDLQLSADGESISGSVDLNSLHYDFTLDKAFYSRDNPAPAAGYFTATLPSPGADFPGGTGYAGITVSTTGQVKVVGRLADGTRLSGSSTLSKGDRFAFAQILYGRQGVIGGYATFTSPDSGSGTFAWVRRPEAARDFLTPESFSGSIAWDIQRYTPPANGTGVFPAPSATGQASVQLSGGNLSTALAKAVAISGNQTLNVVATDGTRLKASIVAKTGVVTGTASVDLGGKTRTVTFRGIADQAQNTATGYFLGLNQSGTFVLAP